MRHLLVTVALCVLATVAFAQSPVPAPPGHVLQGAWVIESLDSEPAPANTVLLLTVAADGTYVATVDGKVEERGTIRVDSTQKPMTLDFAISEGSSAGKTQLGVFEVTATSLKIALADPGGTQRPTDFAIKKEHEVIVLKKK